MAHEERELVHDGLDLNEICNGTQIFWDNS